MNPLLETQERYTHKTLQGLYYAALYSGHSEHGILRITFIDNSYGIREANVTAVGAHGAYIHIGDGILEVPRAAITRAEII